MPLCSYEHTTNKLRLQNALPTGEWRCWVAAILDPPAFGRGNATRSEERKDSTEQG